MKRTRAGVLAVLSILAPGMAACDSEGENESLPEPTGASVWEYLQQENYQQT